MPTAKNALLLPRAIPRGGLGGGRVVSGVSLVVVVVVVGGGALVLVGQVQGDGAKKRALCHIF